MYVAFYFGDFNKNRLYQSFAVGDGHIRGYTAGGGVRMLREDEYRCVNDYGKTSARKDVRALYFQSPDVNYLFAGDHSIEKVRTIFACLMICHSKSFD